MAIESAAYFRRLARVGMSFVIGALSLCGVAVGQNSATPGSVVPLQQPSGTSPAKPYIIDIAPNGDALFEDVGTGSGALWILPHGSTTFSAITTTISPSGDTYYNEGMAIDAKGNLYISARYGTPLMYRVPNNNGSYVFNASGDNWEPTVNGDFSGGVVGLAFLDSPAKDGSGLLVLASDHASSGQIYVVPVNADGTVPLFTSGANAGLPVFQYVISGLKGDAQELAIDVNGNIYFSEDPYDGAAKRTNGVYFIPATAYQSCLTASEAGTGTPTTPCISGSEASLSRIDPGNTEKFNGIALDAAGNAYVGETSDGNGGTTNGLVEIPNQNGSPVGVTAASFNFTDAAYLSPAPVNGPPTIDPRGFFWFPQGGATPWSPAGSGALPGTGGEILYTLGTANLGATLEGTPSATGLLFYSFSNTVMPGSFVFTQPGGATEFSASATNPYPPAAGTTPAVPCGTTTAGVQNTYNPNDSCEYWVTLTPSGTNSVGSISGQLSILDTNNNLVSGSTANLAGIGEGPAVALLSPTAQTPLSTTLQSPQQVSGDPLGNSYVADSGLHEVLEFPAGSTTASAGTPIGTGLKAPTGVAVDGNENVYIGDSGSVIEYPAANGKVNPTGTPLVLASGLGANLDLAVDGVGNVYAADPANARVVKIFNPAMSVAEGTRTVGSGFTKPTAVAVDDSGNLYVADGTKLDEINFWGLQTTITSSLTAPVTGLALDPSNSVYVAQTGGILRIPYETSSTGGGLVFNDAAGIDTAGVTAPTGVALDSLGNLYTAAASYSVTNYTGTAAPTTTTVTTPTLLSLSGANVSFGVQSTQTQSDPIDVDVYDIGNEPLAITPGSPSFAGTNGTDYSVETDGQNPCDTTNGTPIVSGSACTLGVTVTAQNNDLSQATMALATTAINAPTINGTLEAYAENNLCLTKTSITLTPAANLGYPASTTVAVMTVPVDPTCSPGTVPTGGKIALTLSPQAKGSSQTTQTETLNNENATFNLTGLNGGTYIVYASYKGDPIWGGSSSSRTFSFVVAQAAPTVALSNPEGVTAVNGVYYVKQGSPTTLQASVTSPAGSPTGSVQFLNNGSAPADPTQNPVTLDGNGNASFNTVNLANGTYNLTAVYGGDLNFASATSPVVTIVVIPPSVVISANPAAISTTAGTPVTSTLTITPLEGYTPQTGVQLYCDNTTLPQYAECTFDVPTIDLYDNKGVPQTSHVTISSNLPVNVGSVSTDASPLAFAGMFGLGIFGLALRKRGVCRRQMLTIVCLLLLAGSLLGLAGCTNSGYTHTPPAPHDVTPSGTYNVRIYAVEVDNGQTTSLPFTLTVTVK